MAQNPNPDRNNEFMHAEHGTACLITDIKADKYLRQAKNFKIANAVKDSWTI